jgi:hypothetical protein
MNENGRSYMIIRLLIEIMKERENLSSVGFKELLGAQPIKACNFNAPVIPSGKCTGFFHCPIERSSLEG